MIVNPDKFQRGLKIIRNRDYSNETLEISNETAEAFTCKWC